MNGYAALDGFPCPCYGVVKRAQTDRPLAPSLNYGLLCHAIGVEKACIHGLHKGKMRVGKGFILVPLKMTFYWVTELKYSHYVRLCLSANCDRITIISDLLYCLYGG